MGLIDSTSKKLSEQIDIPEEDVKSVLRWVYTKTKEQFRNPDILSVELSGLGHYEILPYRLDNRLEVYENRIERDFNGEGGNYNEEIQYVRKALINSCERKLKGVSPRGWKRYEKYGKS